LIIAGVRAVNSVYSPFYFSLRLVPLLAPHETCPACPEPVEGSALVPSTVEVVEGYEIRVKEKLIW